MEPIFFALPESRKRAARLARMLDASVGEVAVRRFPDGESWVRVSTGCENRQAIVVADLTRPDPKICQLLFLTQTLREMGAAGVGLVAPYLAYMRQDERFEPGEAVTSAHFADLLGNYFDWLATLDPHLHRHGSLSDIYRIPTFVARSAPSIARWVEGQKLEPLIVGPDAESEQWVDAVTRLIDCPSVVFEKTRRGDRDVELGEADLTRFRGRKAVILDDIISSGATMAETIGRLKESRFPAPICLGIHAVFADGARERLERAGAADIVTCNSIPHATNAIDITPAVADQVRAALRHDSADAAE